MRLNHTGVVPGERFDVSGEVVNESSRDIDGVNIILLETSIFKKKHVTSTQKVLEIKRGKVDPYTTHSLDGTVITIPSLAPSMVTSLMNVSYWLKLEVELPGFDLEPQIMLTLGTVPIHRILCHFGPICVSAEQHWGEVRLEKKERKEKYRGDIKFVPLYKVNQHLSSRITFTGTALNF